jgi:hypothetical protein
MAAAFSEGVGETERREAPQMDELKMLICANRIVIYRYTQKDYFSHNSMELDSIEGDTPVFGEEITVCVFQ